MFGGECWITKIYTVLVDCQNTVYKCCDGYEQTGTVNNGQKPSCVRLSGCGGLRELSEEFGNFNNFKKHCDLIRYMIF